MLFHVERLPGRRLRTWHIEGGVRSAVVDDHLPYFKVRLEDPSAADAIRGLEGVREVAPFRPSDGVWRVAMDDPSRTRQLSRAVEALPGVAEAFENDIVFLQRFCYDRVTGLMEGLAWDGLCVLALDIETEFERNRTPDPSRHRVTHVGVRWRDRHGREGSELISGDEAEVLARFCARVREADPDVVVTFNGDEFDMPFIMERCRRAGVPFDIGREGLECRIRTDAMCGRLREARNSVVLPGRVHVDLYVLVKRNPRLALLLENFSLEEVARVMGVPKRVTSELWDEDEAPSPERVGEKCSEDVAVTLQLADRLVPQEVELSKIVNLPLDVTYRAGNSHLIEGLMIREYTREHVVPNRRGKVSVVELASARSRDLFIANTGLRPVRALDVELEGEPARVDVLSKLPADELEDLLAEVGPVLAEFAEVTVVDRYKANKTKGWLKGRRYALVLTRERPPVDEWEALGLVSWGRPAKFAGGFVDLPHPGLHTAVAKFDVQSMYPFIMLVFGLRPRSDHLGAYLPLLERLTRWRLSIKEEMRRPGADRAVLDARQTALKGLINSFYGYMAFSFSRWRDYAGAAEITAKGREIIQRAVSFLEGEGCQVIEVDTDGIYFSGRRTRGEYESLLRSLNSTMPSSGGVSITIELEQVIENGIFYKSKNYALLVGDALVLKGSSFKSKKLPRIIREGIEGYTRTLLRTADREQARAVVEAVRRRLERGEVGAADVALKERLVKPPDAYEPGQYPHAEAAKVLEREFGRATGPGYHMRYFVAKGLGKAVAPRALPLERFSPDAVDAAYYIEKLEERVGIIEDMAFPRPRPVQSTLLGF